MPVFDFNSVVDSSHSFRLSTRRGMAHGLRPVLPRFILLSLQTNSEGRVFRRLLQDPRPAEPESVDGGRRSLARLVEHEELVAGREVPLLPRRSRVQLSAVLHGPVLLLERQPDRGVRPLLGRDPQAIGCSSYPGVSIILVVNRWALPIL